MSRARGRPKGGWIPDAERKPALQRIKERHRLLAKYIAAGLTRNEIASRLDYTPERVGQLSLDPAMQNLVAGYRDDPAVHAMVGFDEITLLRSISMQNALRSAIAIRDSLDYYEEADEKMPIRESAKIFEISSDRIGFGKHSTNVNVNVDFAAQLDQAINRSRSAKTVSVKANSPPALQLPSSTGSAPALPVNLRGGRGQEHDVASAPAPKGLRRF